MKEINFSRRQGLAALGATVGATLLGAGVPGRAQAATSYKVSVTNLSELQNATIALFAVLPEQFSYEDLGLAWKVHSINRRNTWTFNWEINWDFVWSASDCVEGGIWEGGGSLPADPSSPAGCAAIFDYFSDDFALEPKTYQKPAGKSDILWVQDTKNLPANEKTPATVGIALNGDVCAFRQAGANLNQTFTLHPTYFINAGSYQSGQMVDSASVANFYKLDFAGGKQHIKMLFDKDNTLKEM